MKCDISRNKNSVRVKIKDFESFNIERKTKKDTLPCPWRKFGSGLRNGGCKTWATKSFEIRIIWKFVEKKFKRSFIL